MSRLVRLIGLSAATTVLVGAALLGAAAGGPVPAARADAVRDSLWQLDALDLTAAWEVTEGAGVTVAVVDSGVDGAQQDLDGNVLAGTNFTGPGDGNTVIGTHGTAMAGIIAAHGRGADGMLGIAPEARILPVVENDSTSAAKAIRWAADNGAGVINCSFTSDRDTPELRKAIAYALSRDVVVVAGAGNSGGAVGSPGSYAGLISVSGLTRTDALTSLSARGPEVDLAAPAEDITSTGPGDTYVIAEDGTSSSAAIVSGVVALVRAAYPDLDAANVVNRVVSTARDIGSAGRDDDFGYGAVDPVAALTAGVAAVDENPLGTLESGGTTSTAQPTDDSPAVETTGPAASQTSPAPSPEQTCDGVSSTQCPVALAATDARSGSSAPWWVVGGAAAVLLGLAAWLMLRRRSVATAGGAAGPPSSDPRPH